MEIRHQIKTSSLKALTALAIAIGTIGAIDLAATAAPTKESLKLAQVGIRSRINAPIPLNLRPRTHIPSPSSNHYRPGRSYRRNHGGRDYGYYEGHHHHYRDRYQRHRYNTYQKRRSNRGRVIILNAPGSFRGYGDRNSYIRIIGK